MRELKHWAATTAWLLVASNESTLKDSFDPDLVLDEEDDDDPSDADSPEAAEDIILEISMLA